jgi:methylglutaconyl-CoA hydratase
VTDETVIKINVVQEVATVTLSRPQSRNALNEALIVLLTQAFQKFSVAEAIRVVVLKGEGPVFCAGGDLKWLGTLTKASAEDRLRHAMQFAQMFDAINRCAKPVLAIAHGTTSGAGVGLLACAHIVIAPPTASFTLLEARRGLSSSVMVPYLAAALSGRALQRYLTTGETLSAQQAQHLGLIHDLASSPDDTSLAELESAMVAAILKGAPATIANALDTIRVCLNTPDDPDRMRWAAQRFAEVLGSPEAQEGIGSFEEKRQPEWTR